MFNNKDINIISLRPYSSGLTDHSTKQSLDEVFKKIQSVLMFLHHT